MSIEGVSSSFLPSSISIILGRPRVTFISMTPAKWNVFSVIWVPGSPIDSAEINPTASPDCTLALLYSSTVASSIFLNLAALMLPFFSTYSFMSSSTLLGSLSAYSSIVFSIFTSLA